MSDNTNFFKIHGVTMDKLFIEDLELKGKRVLIRVDFNVPLNENLEILTKYLLHL